ncbi:Hydrogen peroxide-inducible genes activator [Burkholderiales bacterium]|nr:MAG: hydrogen peroxide-inducible genes activator [Burkholderiales bacterium]CAG0976322.1 Hydrogen peroxide-inducible genes activator [Burkholderiales bacterium]
MTLTELRYIVALAQERHFGKAAAKCFVSQPTLSVAIQKLEEELGVALFERLRGEVAITDVGERVINQAQRALDEAEKVKQIARGGRDQLSEPLRLGVIPTIAPYLLPELIPRVQKRAPSMVLDIEENLTGELQAALLSGRLDVLLLALPFDPPGVDLRPLYDEAFSVVLPSEHPLAKKKQLRTADLENERVLLLRAGHCLSDQVLSACGEVIRPNAHEVGYSIETMRQMVAAGLGISVFPASALARRLESKLVQTVPFAPPVPHRRVVLAWRKSFTRPAAIDALDEAVRAIRADYFQMIPA